MQAGLIVAHGYRESNVGFVLKQSLFSRRSVPRLLRIAALIASSAVSPGNVKR